MRTHSVFRGCRASEWRSHWASRAIPRSRLIRLSGVAAHRSGGAIRCACCVRIVCIPGEIRVSTEFVEDYDIPNASREAAKPTREAAKPSRDAAKAARRVPKAAGEVAKPAREGARPARNLQKLSQQVAKSARLGARVTR